MNLGALWLWWPTLLLGLLFGHHAIANARAFTTSPAGSVRLRPLLGGVAGSLACWLAPAPAMATLWWLPLLLDLGCLPYQLLGLCALTASARPSERSASERAAAGCLVGSAIGDGIGLPAEGLSRRRLARYYPGPPRPRLLAGRMLGSDDSEHACLTAQALLGSGGDPDRFAADLAYRLRWWLAALPAGVGLATLRSIVRLWLGWPPGRAGVRSAGNGAAMRSALLGCCFGHDPQRLQPFVSASSRLTHRDPRAEHGALAIALAAALACSEAMPDAPRYRALLSAHLPAGATLDALLAAIDSAERGEASVAFAERIGCAAGVSGFVLHSVPVVIQVWLCHPEDYRSGLRRVIDLGGDTDSTAAMLGGLIGARVGVDGIPIEWRQAWIDWPRSLGHIEALGARAGWVAQRQLREPELPLFLPALIPRNLLFLLVVLAHGLRRLLPPYG